MRFSVRRPFDAFKKLNYFIIRNSSNSSNTCQLKESKNIQTSCERSTHVKPFNEIPGPKSLPGIGTLWQYLPVIGRYSFNALHHAGMLKYQRYGHLVREAIAPGTTLLWVFNPDDIATVLKDGGPGQYPERRSHLALQKYRLDRPDIYKTGGLLPTNGPEWWRLRCEFQRGFSSPQSAHKFLPAADKVTLEFCDRVETYRNKQCDDFLPELSRLNLELVCLLAFDVRLDSFSPRERYRYSRTSLLLQSAETTNSCILPTDQGFRLWRYFPTPKYWKLQKAQNYMEEVAIELVAQKMSFFEDSTVSRSKIDSDVDLGPSLLETYLSNPKLDLRDIVGMAADLLLAGVDTTAYTTSFALYHLARNPRTQDLLYQECVSLLPCRSDQLTPNLLQKASYTKAVLKESLRLNPISIGVGRTLTQDLVLSGYSVPKGTIAVTQNQVASRLESNFPKANAFIPERWLKSHQTKNQPTMDTTEFPTPNPYLLLPFGHGVRACIARRFAEQNIHVLLIRLIRNFEISWDGSDMDVQTLLINKPDQPIKLSFKPR